MSQPYDSFRYIEPPRTEVKSRARGTALLEKCERQGWLAQVKKNGSRLLTVVAPDGDIEAWNRHGEKQAWQFTPETADLFVNLPRGHWYLFDGELMHRQTAHIKNIIYLYDILVCAGTQLTGTTYQHRYDVMLGTLVASSSEHRTRNLMRPTHRDYFVMHPNVWVARNHTKGFTKLFNGLTEPEDEGLVMKDPNGVYYTSKADQWMAKVRRK